MFIFQIIDIYLARLCLNRSPYLRYVLAWLGLGCFLHHISVSEDFVQTFACLNFVHQFHRLFRPHGLQRAIQLQLHRLCLPLHRLHRYLQPQAEVSKHWIGCCVWDTTCSLPQLEPNPNELFLNCFSFQLTATFPPQLLIQPTCLLYRPPKTTTFLARVTNLTSLTNQRQPRPSRLANPERVRKAPKVRAEGLSLACLNFRRASPLDTPRVQDVVVNRL